jgi:hypothetical protein
VKEKEIYKIVVKKAFYKCIEVKAECEGDARYLALKEANNEAPSDIGNGWSDYHNYAELD